MRNINLASVNISGRPNGHGSVMSTFVRATKLLLNLSTVGPEDLAMLRSHMHQYLQCTSN